MVVAIIGCDGRVGKEIVKLARKKGHAVLAIDKNKQIWLNENRSTDGGEAKIDVAIDFSSPSALPFTAEFCKTHRCGLVYGVTGLSFEQEQLLAELGKTTPIVRQSNFSQGAKLLVEIAEIVARARPDWDCDVVEIHRKGKADSPSGTAKCLAYRLSEARGSFSATEVHALRSGTEFGTHTVIFGGNGESLTITHRAESVEIFARGALEEAEKLAKKTTIE